MIHKQRALFYFVGEHSFKDLPSAQVYDLKKLVPDELITGNVNPDDAREKIAAWMLKDAEPIVDILTTTPTSRLKARKTHGGVRPSRKKLQPAVKLEQRPAPKPQPQA